MRLRRGYGEATACQRALEDLAGCSTRSGEDAVKAAEAQQLQQVTRWVASRVPRGSLHLLFPAGDVGRQP